MMWEIIKLYVFSPLFGVVTTTGLIGAACIALFLFTPAFVPGQFRTICGIVGVALLSGGIFYWFAFHQGETFMAKKIAARDQAALQRVEEGQREVNACNGGVDWDVTTGTCAAK